MRCDGYHKLMQAEAELDVKVRHLLMNQYSWNLDDFVYFEKQVPSPFTFANKVNYDCGPKRLKEIYDQIITWMKQGWRPRHIEANSLKNYYAFSKDGFFKKDIETIVSFCKSIEALEQKIILNEELFLRLSGACEDSDDPSEKMSKHPVKEAEIQEKWETFQKLVLLVKKLREKFEKDRSKKP